MKYFSIFYVHVYVLSVYTCVQNGKKEGIYFKL